MLNSKKDQINVKIELRDGRISREVRLNGIRCQKMEQEMKSIEEENFS